MYIGLTVDAVGSTDEFRIFFEVLKDFRIKATFFVNIGKENLIEKIYKMGHEIGNHTYTHPTSILSMTKKNKKNEVQKAHNKILEILNKESKNIEINGFRVPYYYFDKDIFKILNELDYKWDSSKGYFPIMGNKYKAEKFGNIVELPSLFPDDDTLLNKNCLSEVQVLKIWKKSYDLSDGTFIWGIHPYVSVKNEERVEMLKKFLEYVTEKNGEFLTLTEIVQKTLKI
jgi:peptidoglycan/xylan/chitin deacetylase (PgdA/CDA1 family)